MLKKVLYIVLVLISINGCVGTLRIADAPLHSMHSAFTKSDHKIIMKNSKAEKPMESNSTN